MPNLTDSEKQGDILIQEFEGHLSSQTDRQSDDFCVLFLDVETTGISFENDKIIQLALRPVFVNRSSFKISKLAGIKILYNDPGIEISDEITALTGVTADTVKGQTIDWEWVGNIVGRVDLIVCHNAKFDRNFVMRHLQEANISEPLTVWACTWHQIDWKNVCRGSQALEVLCVWHGFYYGAHDAGRDVDALIHLITVSNRMEELVTNAQKSQWRVFAVDLPYEKKDEIKARRYQWDNEVRMWFIGIADEAAAKAELDHIAEKFNIQPQLFEIEPRYLFA